MFCKNGFLTNFAKFTGKYLRGTLVFDKCAGLIPATLSKKRLQHNVFSCELLGIFKDTYLHLLQLLLTVTSNRALEM